MMLFALLLTLAAPTDWVPARWHGSRPRRSTSSPARPSTACWSTGTRSRKRRRPLSPGRPAERGVATLAVIRPGGDPAEPARDAIRAKFTGVVLEGDFSRRMPPNACKAAVAPAPLIELTLRSRMPLGSKAPVIGT